MLKHRDQEEGRLVPLREIADKRMLPFSIRTLMRLIEQGRITAVNIGAGAVVPRWAITEGEIARFKRTAAPRGTYETK
jgi:hypothetical protein